MNLPVLRVPRAPALSGTERLRHGNSLKLRRDSGVQARRSSFSRKLGGKPSAAKSAKTMHFDQANIKKVCVRMLGTWGQSPLISCAQIVILGNNGVPLKVEAVITHPLSTKDSNTAALSDGNMFKTSLSDCWQTSFPPSGSPYVDLSFIIDPISNPSAVRFYNIGLQGASAVKDVEIWLNEIEVWAGQVSPDFGTIASFVIRKHYTSESPASFHYKLDLQRGQIDHFGRLPYFATRVLKLRVLANWGNEFAIGLCGIQIFDIHGKKLQKQDFVSMEITNCATNIDMEELLIDSAPSADIDRMWTATLEDGVPELRIVLTRCISISKLLLINFNAREMDLSTGVKKLMLLGDQGLVWIGRVKQGLGHLENIPAITTEILLSDCLPE